MGEIVMPRLSDSMEQGTILRWLKADGEQVKRGDEILEIETDKASMPYESDQEGVLQIVAAEGSSHPVGAVIGHVNSDAETAAAQPEVAEVSPTPVDEPEKFEAAVDLSRSVVPGERIKATPVARRIAESLEVDLATVTGSGPGGRIVKQDVEQAAAGTQQPAVDQRSSSDVDTAVTKRDTTRQEITRTQQTIARRMAESRATVPDFSVRLEVDMERAWDQIAQLKEMATEGEQTPSVNDLILKATALALREHPKLNASYRDAGFEFHSRINVGLAVATEQGLLVPTVFDTDQKSLAEISQQTRKLVAKGRSGELTPPELSGGTFTVSNLGMFGIDEFTAVINPPQAAILTVGSVRKRPYVYQEQLVVRRTAKFELSCDHRIVYGADAAAFLHFVGELLEHPASL